MHNPILIIGREKDTHSVSLRQALSRAGVPFSVVSVKERVPASFEGARVVVPMSEEALVALTDKRNLNTLRGSILPLAPRYHAPQGAYLVIPTLPASSLTSSPNWFPRVIHDLQRAYRYTQARYRPVEHRYLSRPLREDIDWFIEELDAREHCADPDSVHGLSLDIETNPTQGTLLCVGFALSPTLAICIPWDRKWQKDLITQLCEHPAPKILQNGLYDTYWLAQEGVRLVNWQWDTLYMHHVLHPTEPHDLAFLTSMYTEEPYYKDEATQDLWLYNCKDAAVTWEIAEVLKQHLEERRMFDFYRHHYQALLDPLLEMMLGGIGLDEQRRRQQYLRLTEHGKDLRAAIGEETGVDLCTPRALRVEQLRAYLYETLQLPKRFVHTPLGKTGALSTDDTTLRFLTKKHPEQFGEVGRLLLDYKQTQRRKHAYDPQQVDGDGKVRFGLKLNTETGRIASREHPKGGGGALADHPRDCRDMFLPDPGHLFLEVSLSHAAERIVCCLSGKAHLIDKAMTPTWEDEPVDLEDYERWIRQQVMTHRALANSWGRVISWPFDYLTPALYRRAYAWLPESEIAGLLATKGITPLAVYLKKHTQHHHIRLVCQVDDSLLISTPPLYAWVVYAFLRDVLAYPLPLRGGNLVIPVEATLGRTWQGEVVLTCPVGRDEFTALMETLL